MASTHTKSFRRDLLGIVLVAACIAMAAVPGAAESETVNPGNGEQVRRIEVTADGFQAHTRENYAEFSGNVKAVQGSFAINSDRLLIYYKPEGAEGQEPAAMGKAAISRIVASGNVRIDADGRMAQTEEAIYVMDSQELVLSGPNSTLSSENNRINGSRITFNRLTRQVKVEGSGQHRVNGIFYASSAQKRPLDDTPPPSPRVVFLTPPAKRATEIGPKGTSAAPPSRETGETTAGGRAPAAASAVPFQGNDSPRATVLPTKPPQDNDSPPSATESTEQPQGNESPPVAALPSERPQENDLTLAAAMPTEAPQEEKSPPAAAVPTEPAMPEQIGPEAQTPTEAEVPSPQALESRPVEAAAEGEPPAAEKAPPFEAAPGAVEPLALARAHSEPLLAAPPEPPPVSKPARVPLRNLTKRIGLATFENTTAFRQKGLATFMLNQLAAAIREESPQVKLLLPEAPNYPPTFVDLPRQASGRINNQLLVQIGRRLGLNAIVTGSLADIKIMSEPTGFWIFKGNRIAARMAVRGSLYDTQTGTKLMDELLVRKVEVDEADLYAAQKGQAPDIPGLESALTDMARELGKSVAEKVERQPWRGYIVRVDADRVARSAGEATGLRVGNELVVHDETPITGLAGHLYFLPGRKTATLRITAVTAEASEAMITSQGPVREGLPVSTPEDDNGGSGWADRLKFW